MQHIINSAIKMKELTAFLIQLSPNRARKSWIVVDSIVVVWSVLLLVELLTPFTSRLEGEREYLVYNFGATLVWMVASGLHLLDHCIKYHGGGESSANSMERNANHPPRRSQISDDEQKDVRFLVLEWIIAVYFLYDSTKVYRQWQQPDEDVEVALLDTVINAASYTYQVLMVLSLIRKDDYTEIPSVQSIDV